jgi:hypothetical protein
MGRIPSRGHESIQHRPAGVQFAHWVASCEGTARQTVLFPGASPNRAEGGARSADRSRSATRISPVMSLCNNALNRSSRTARSLRCSSVLRSIASRMATISRRSSRVGGTGIRTPICPPFRNLILGQASRSTSARSSESSGTDTPARYGLSRGGPLRWDRERTNRQRGAFVGRNRCTVLRKDDGSRRDAPVRRFQPVNLS